MAMKTWKILLSMTWLLAAVTPSRGEQITALALGDILVRFNSTNPNGILGAPVTVTGLTAGDSLFAIDFRPIDGVLVGLGYNSGAGTGRVYSINTSTGAATKILAANLPLGPALTQFGFDFNPVANALRIVDPNGNNTRITSGGAGSVIADTNINPAGNNLVGLAYSNNLAGATTTTLFAAAANSASLVTVNPPNNGTVSSVGALGITGSAVTGLDISGATGVAYLSSNPSSGLSKLFTVNLATGAATEVIGVNGNGNIGGGLNIRDISVVAAASQAGDFDLDGDVDGRDFLVWQRGGSPNPLSSTDLANWQANYGFPPLTAVSTAVPEPGSLVLVLMGFALLGVVGRRDQISRNC